MASDEVTAEFAGWLYRPFVDLGPWEAGGNPATLGLARASTALVEGHDDSVRQNTGVALSSFRGALLRATGLARYLVEDPAELARADRTPPWQVLCDHLDAYDALDPATRLRVLWLLNRLTLHPAILAYEGRRRAHGGTADLSTDLMCAIARMYLFADGRGRLDLRGLELLEGAAPLGSWEHLETTYLLAQTAAKVLDDVALLRRQLARHRSSIDAVPRPDHERAKLLSRYHRLGAFLPQLEGDLDAMVREMDRAERWCDLMSRDESGTRADWEIFRYALLESRVKERFARDDFPGAERYALALVEHAPTTPNARLTLGQARIERGDVEGALESYRWAVVLGPHVAAEAEFMAGQCLERLGRGDAARSAYLRSLTADPLAVSAVERLRDSGLAAGTAQLDVWVAGRAQALREATDRAEEGRRAYQAYGGLLGGDR